MEFELDIFKDENLSPDFLQWLIEHRWQDIIRHFGRLWDYYTNPSLQSLNLNSVTTGENSRCYIQAQEYGLPARITGSVHNQKLGIFGSREVRDIQRKEVVIENDIGWRINAGVDFLFGKPINIVSLSPDAQKRQQIEKIIKSIFDANGGIGFFQDLAVLGSVYGFVDCLVRPGARIFEKPSPSSSQTHDLEDVLKKARAITLELIEAPRALPVLDEEDWRKIRIYIQHFCQKQNKVNSSDSFLSRLISPPSSDKRQTIEVTEIMSPDAWQRYENGKLTEEGEMPWGFLPVVHIQNMAQPFYYEGISDVEPLVPLQDELNTRLSDRANRITFQSFKMYLGKGIEGFENRPVSPGRMWFTDNIDASIDEFGGDIYSPSEDRHIEQIREALDKTSSVTPIVAGIIRGKVGNLTSAVALRLMLMAMLSKTERKRHSYGQGIKEICSQVLSILNTAGIYKTSEEDRLVDVVFANPLPENMMEKLQEAQMKKQLGVSAEKILTELGYRVND